MSFFFFFWRLFFLLRVEDGLEFLNSFLNKNFGFVSFDFLFWQIKLNNCSSPFFFHSFYRITSMRAFMFWLILGTWYTFNLKMKLKNR